MPCVSRAPRGCTEITAALEGRGVSRHRAGRRRRTAWICARWHRQPWAGRFRWHAASGCFLGFPSEPLVGFLLCGPASITRRGIPGRVHRKLSRPRGFRARIGPASLFGSRTASCATPACECGTPGDGADNPSRIDSDGRDHGGESQVPSFFDTVTTVPHGRLECSLLRRLLLLNGLPRETGLAHGRLLAPEVRRVVDSTLYVVGLGYSIESGKWFPDEIRDAWRRLEPLSPPTRSRKSAASRGQRRDL